MQNFNLAAVSLTMLGSAATGTVTREVWPLLPAVPQLMTTRQAKEKGQMNCPFWIAETLSAQVRWRRVTPSPNIAKPNKASVVGSGTLYCPVTLIAYPVPPPWSSRKI